MSDLVTVDQARARADRIRASAEAVRRSTSCRPTSPKLADQRDVYFIQAETGQIKIGVAGDVASRLETLRAMSPVALRLIGVVRGHGQELERSLHARFSFARLHGEWFSPVVQLLDYIRSEA